MATITDIKYNVLLGSPETLLGYNKISNEDLPLIQRLDIDTTFNPSKNRIDIFFYSLDGRLLGSRVDSINYSVLSGGSREDGKVNDLNLDPEKDVIEQGFKNGDVNVLYNFINNLFSDSKVRPFFYIESISPDRTEIRALSNDLKSEDIIFYSEEIKNKLDSKAYFEDFRLNFNSNRLPIAVNIETAPYKDSQAVFIKLYEPLPTSFTVKSQFTIEELVGDSILYQVVTEVSSTEQDSTKILRGPNYDIEIVEENNNPTGYLSYEDLFSYPVSNSYYEVYSLFNERGAQISIDHTNFEEFINFSSAEERLRNFYYKASLLENYRNQINARNTFTGSLEDSIEGIISNFDHYDRFLYYSTGSYSWPKSTSNKPYELHTTGSSEVQNWYTNLLLSSSIYDSKNNDRLINAIPSFIREDNSNSPYLLFVDMIGQHFDNLWIYMKAVTDKYDADNRLEYGISKDLVRDAIENFGIKLYNNNEALENLFAAFTGETYNTGSESTVVSLITAVEGSGSLSGSAGNEHLQPMPKESYQKEVYKRIYHNIPLLLKSKGTERGLRALINAFGVPSNTLTIKSFGGADKSSTPFYGPNTQFTSSLDKIKISNTDTVLTGSTLSNFSQVVQSGKDYSNDLHTVEVGFSPSDSLNDFIRAHPSMSTFNIDQYIGDPGYAHSSSYDNLESLADTVFTSGSSYIEVFDAFEFIRLIKFFDNSIFRVIKDFLPARSNLDTGIIIKPHLLDRSKIKQPQVGWSNQTSPGFIHSGTQLDYTGSYYSTNFSIDGEIDTAFISGSTGFGTIDSASYSYTETYANPSGGYQILTRNNHDQAAYTGELQGTTVTVSNGDLTTGNTFRKLEPEQLSFKYIPRNDFSTPQDALDLFTKTVSLNNIVESTSESPSQAGEGSDPLVLSIPAYNSVYGYNKVQFNLDGGPIDGTPAIDSGSILWDTDEELDTNDSVLIDFTVDFNDISSFVDDGGTLTEVTLAIYSGSSTGISVPVSTQTVTRTSLSSQREFVTLSYTNTGSLLTGDPQKWYWKASYKSNYNTENILSNVNDVEISLKPILTYYDTDAITLYLSETIENDFTSSKAEAMIVPFNSPTNGFVKPYIEQANEVVFQYSAFATTDNYDNNIITSSVEGGSYRANISLTDNDINLTHITSAPYSASFTQALPTLTDGDTLKFNFTVDFDSYWSTYLNTYSLSNTPFVTASIRNKDTEIVTGSLSFQIQQGQYPNEYKRTLSYLNDTGGDLQDLELYYQVNIPSSFGASNPKVNLKNISITYNTPNTMFLSTGIKSFKNVGFDLGFLQFSSPIEVNSGSLEYFTINNDYFNVGFLPGESELFKFNDYASTSNNVDSVRRSTTKLVVDEKTYTPTQGPYKGFFLPSNYAILSSSIVNGVEGLDERFFAEVQDSNYYATGWRNGRYDGSESTNLVGGFAVLGREPALTYEIFEGSLFDNISTSTDIKAKFSGSEIKEGDVEVYYNTYTLQGEELLTLSNVSSQQTNGTVGTINSTTYEVDINNTDVGSGTYSGSIGTLNKNDRISIDFDVLLENVVTPDLDIGDITVNLKEPGNVIPVLNQSFNGTEFTEDLTVNKSFTFNSLPKNINTGILEFRFLSIEDDGGGSPNFTLSINSIRRINLLPFGSSQDTIVPSDSTGRTIFYNKQIPTPTSPGGYVPIIKSKIYRFDNSLVYTTDDKGVVTNIE